MTRRVPPDEDWTDREADGQPYTEDQPPGIDADSASEGTYPPGDELLGADAYGVTAFEESTPESVEEREARQRPEAAPHGRERSIRLVEDSDEDYEGGQIPDAELEEEDPDEPASSGLSAEEAAMHVIEGE